MYSYITTRNSLRTLNFGGQKDTVSLTLDYFTGGETPLSRINASFYSSKWYLFIFQPAMINSYHVMMQPPQ